MTRHHRLDKNLKRKETGVRYQKLEDGIWNTHSCDILTLPVVFQEKFYVIYSLFILGMSWKMLGSVLYSLCVLWTVQKLLHAVLMSLKRWQHCRELFIMAFWMQQQSTL